MDLGLTGKRALVLSSSRGLGLGIAQSLAAEGVDVMMTARTGDRLQAAADAINARGKGRAHTFAAISPATWRRSTGRRGRARPDRHPGRQHGRAAGPHRAGGEAGGMGAAVRGDGAPGLRSPAWCCRGMRERGWGRILTVASSGVVQPIPNLVISNALRSSLLGWAKTLASEVAKDGVTVNLVLPGRIEPTASGSSTPPTPRRRARPSTRLPPPPAPHPGGPLWPRGGVRRRGLLPRLRAGELHHRPDARRRRRGPSI